MSDMPSPEAYRATEEALAELGIDIAEGADNATIAAFTRIFMRNQQLKIDLGISEGNQQ